MKTVIAANPPTGYVALPNILVSKEKLTKIDTKIREHLQSGKLSLTEATRILETEGVAMHQVYWQRLATKLLGTE